MNIDRLQKHSGIDAADTENSRAYRRRNSGASLVEVLVVLVVILIGVFAVIQIFPVGFTTLRRSESRLRADRLARGAAEEITSNPAESPEAITFSYYDPVTKLRRNVTNVDPDDLTTYQNDPQNKLYFSDVNKFRYIVNEPVRIPLASVTDAPADATQNGGFGAGVGSIHFLKFGPVYMDESVGGAGSAPNYGDTNSVALFDSYLKVTSDKLIGVTVNSTGSDNNLDPAENFARYLRGVNYAIDYGDDNSAPVVLFPRNTKPCAYTVTYVVENDTVDPPVLETVSTTITVPGGTLQWSPLGNKPVQPGSESITRNFTRLIQSEPWDTNDPYQYKLASSNVSPSANPGIISFNPTGANYSVRVPGGTKPFTALVSYAVLDWHILHEDVEVPDGNPDTFAAKVTTSLPNIRRRGDDFVDFTQTGADRNQVYPGLYPQQAIYHSVNDIPTEISGISPDIQVFNLSSTGSTATRFAPLVAGDFANRTTTDANADYWINKAGRGGTYPSGTIYVNTQRVKTGSKLRILYKAQGDWALSFQKAAAQYFVNPAGGALPVANEPQSFSVNYGGAGVNDDRIYFHRSEINKGMTASFEVSTNNGIIRIPSRQFTVSTPDGSDYAYVSATEVAPEILQAGVTGWRVNGSIKGASLKTRVIWQDEQNGRNPWRLADLETFITKQAQ